MLYKEIWDDYTGEKCGSSLTDLQVNCSFIFQLQIMIERPKSVGEALRIHKRHNEIT